MKLPNVYIQQVDSAFGNPPTEDGTSLLVLNIPNAYTVDVSGYFYNLKDAEDAGFAEENDLLHDVLAWEHIARFYERAGNGVKLRVLLVDEATIFTDLFTEGETANNQLVQLLAGERGSIKLIGVSLKAANETHTTSISTDLQTAIPLAHTFAGAEFLRNRPVQILLEGRKFSGTIANAIDLRTLNSGKVSVVIGRDEARKSTLIAAGNTGATNYADIGLALGSVARVQVGWDMGRVKSDSLVVDTPALSGGQKIYETYTDTQIETLYNKGYIFITAHAGVAGYYWIAGSTCAGIEKADAFINYNRALQKAARLLITVFARELKDSVVTEAGGKLPLPLVNEYRTLLQRVVEREMINNPDSTRPREISAVTVTINPNQDVLATSNIIVQLAVRPLGTLLIITGQVSLTKN